jgi:xanthine dehydrogenase large subunit
MLVYSSTQNPTEGRSWSRRCSACRCTRSRWIRGAWAAPSAARRRTPTSGPASPPSWPGAAGRAVKLRLAARRGHARHGQAPPFPESLGRGFDDDGVLEALDLMLAGGCGMSPDLSDAIVDRAMFHSDNAYFIPNVQRHRAPRQDAHGVQHRVSRLRRPPGRARHRGRRRRDRPGHAASTPSTCASATSTAAEADRNVTHYGQVVEQQILPALIERLERAPTIAPGATAIRRFQRGQPGAAPRSGPDPGEVRDLLHRKAPQPGRRASARLHDGSASSSITAARKWARACTRRWRRSWRSELAGRSRTHPLYRHAHGQGAQHLADRGVVRQRHQWHGGAERGARIPERRLTISPPGTSAVDQDSVHVFTTTGSASVPGNSASRSSCPWRITQRVSLSATGFYRTPKIHYDRDAPRDDRFSTIRQRRGGIRGPGGHADR